MPRRSFALTAILLLSSIPATALDQSAITEFRESCKTAPATYREMCLRQHVGRHLCTPQFQWDRKSEGAVKAALALDSNTLKALSNYFESRESAALATVAMLAEGIETSPPENRTCNPGHTASSPPALEFSPKYRSIPSTRIDITDSRFRRGDHELFFIPTEHATFLDHAGKESLFAKLEKKVLTPPKPDVLILEIAGFPDVDGYSPCGYAMHILLTPKSQLVSEPEFLARLALEHKIPFLTGEPSETELIQSISRDSRKMLSKYPSPRSRESQRKFSAEDYLYFRAFRCAANRTGPGFEQILEECVQNTLHHPELVDLGLRGPRSASDLKDWYREWNGTELRPGRHIWEETTPTGNMPTNHMSQVTGEIRDAHLRKTISNEMKFRKNVRVVYGSGHLYQSEEAFKALFPDKEKRRKE